MEHHILKPTFTEVYDEKTRHKLKEHFSRLEGECYLDHAGATLYSNVQIQEVFDDLSSSIYANPHSAAAAGNPSQEIVERTRYRILDFFHASSEEYSLVFTSGATSAIKSIADTFKFRNIPDGSPGNFIHLQDNHTSVLGMRDVVAKKGAKVSCLTHNDAFILLSKSSRSSDSVQRHSKAKNNSLFVYSAQCNFSGFKYPLEWIESAHNGVLDDSESNWYVLLDAAAFVGTSPLDLSVYKPDFVAMSFYKMFGYPTGIGGLIVKNSSAQVLEKVYYGGGTVNIALSTTNYHIKRENIYQRFEDGTVPFLSIISLQHGLDAISSIPMSKISSHVFSLARYLHHSLLTLHHSNGNPLVKLYADSDYKKSNMQGGIVTFNVLRSSGEYVGYMEVLHMASLFKIHLRTGCFCNPGACQRHLQLSNEDVLNNYDAGFTCGKGKDLVNARPTGAVRISFGYMSTIADIKTLLLMLRKCFLVGDEVLKVPHWFSEHSLAWKKQYYKENHQITVTMINNNINGSKPELRRDGCQEKRGLTLAKLFIYPIKSCAAYEIEDSWHLGSKGLQYDRGWMIMTSAGIGLTQKHEPMLCLLKPQICLAENVMKLDYPDMPTIELPLNFVPDDQIDGETCRSRVCGHRVEGFDCGVDVSEWLSLAFGRPNLRLVRQSDSKELVDKSKPELSFSSQAQYLLINEASIRWLVDRIPQDSGCDKTTVLERFRGNIIVKGGVGFEEENWVRVKIGNHNFEVNGPCTRCQMVCIDQTTGMKTVEPLRLLAEEFHGKMKFGIYLSKDTTLGGVISIGDSVSCMY